MQKGSRKRPSFPRGLTISPTKCTSQRVIAITAAKPSDEQIEVMRLPLVILAMKAFKAVSGAPAKSAITRPEVKSTRRVSMRFNSAAIVMSTMTAAIQIVQLMRVLP